MFKKKTISHLFINSSACRLNFVPLFKTECIEENLHNNCSDLYPTMLLVNDQVAQQSRSFRR